MPFDQQLLHWDTHAHTYQREGAQHLYNSAAHGGVAVLWLSPGYGKSMMTLHAFKALKDAGAVKNMLIIAPLRVTQTVWAQEIEHWASLAGLTAVRLHGAKKERWLERRDVDIWLINYEGIPWLAKMAKQGRLNFGFDVVVADEIRRLKNSQGTRFKAARPFFKTAKYKWGLTGTPASNGLMDLFGQFLILDDGAALGKTLTRYRMNYFEQGYDGYTYLPRPGAQDAIEARIEPYVFRTEGYLDLPDFIHDTRSITLDEKARKFYTSLKNDLISNIEGTVITAANAAVLTGKLKQLANGRIYDEDRGIREVHTAKQDALIELVEELGDEQLLIAYEYQHDLDQIREVLGDDLPTLSGATERVANEHVRAWNNREIQFLASYPGESHGLNIQKGGAHHILWWGPTFDLDHYIQFNDRLRRQGNTAESVIVHTFVTEKSVDEKAVKSRDGKESLQAAFLSALTAEIGDSIAVDTSREGTGMSQLQFKSDEQQPPQGANPFDQSGGQAQQPPQQGVNPFGQPQSGAQPPQGANPFDQSGGQQQPPQQGVNPMEQQQNIQSDVGAAPPPSPNQAFAAHGVAMGADNPAQGQQQPPQGANPFDQSGGQAQGPAPAANPFDQSGGQQQPPQQNITATPEDRQPPADSGWQPPQGPVEDAQVVSGAAATSAHGDIGNAVGAPGMVPVYTWVPADKLDKVLSAIGRAAKPDSK